MRSHSTEQVMVAMSSEDTLSNRAELCASFLIMLEEAGARQSADDACVVIARILEVLAQDYAEVNPLAHQWRSLTHTPSSHLKLINKGN